MIVMGGLFFLCECMCDMLIIKIQQQWLEFWSWLQVEILLSSFRYVSIKVVIFHECFISRAFFFFHLKNIDISIWKPAINTLFYLPNEWNAASHSDPQPTSRCCASHQMTQSGNNCMIVKKQTRAPLDTWSSFSKCHSIWAKTESKRRTQTKIQIKSKKTKN